MQCLSPRCIYYKDVSCAYNEICKGFRESLNIIGLIAQKNEAFISKQMVKNPLQFNTV